MLALLKKSHWLPFYIYFQSIVIAAILWHYSSHFFMDDAYISLTYARNLLHGDGLTWDGVRVEGYSNFLYVLLITGLGRSGMNLVVASKLLGFVGYFGIVITLFCYTRWHMPQCRNYAYSICNAMCHGLAISSLFFLVWCFGGLESNLYACLLCMGVCQTLRLIGANAHKKTLPFSIGIVFALAALTRPDGIIFCIFTLVFLAALACTKRASIYYSISDIFIIFASLGAVYIPYFCWRYSYYGYWIPNTYYAKEYGISHLYLLSQGLRYVNVFFVIPPFVLLFSFMAIYRLFHKNILSPSLLYLIAFFLLQLIYTIIVGGDSMPYSRFLLPVIPTSILLKYHAGLTFIETRKVVFLNTCGLLLALSLLQCVLINPNIGPSMGILSSEAVENYIVSSWPAGATIALNPVGYLPYRHPQYHYIDMLGLNDTHIAHRVIENTLLVNYPAPGHIKGDGAYVLSRKPDYIMFDFIWGGDNPHYLGDNEIFSNPIFISDYKKMEVQVDPPAEIIEYLKQFPEIKLNNKNQVRFVYYQRKKLI